ncbi:hypothetical protein GGR51DRAFT_507207 [Nemania sp. FL0031]|nr:hypothetical protein GGR51DRAFT_507207 [Nemania sp. FL0031]
MPQDPNLYGQQRPAKKQKREIPLSSSLAFTSQLSSLISAPTAISSLSGAGSSSSGRPRPSKTKNDIFSSVKAKRKPGTSNDSTTKPEDASNSSKIKLKHVHGTEEEKQDFARAKRKMEEKARLYAAMKRGDYIAKENEAAPLVDFDRKWAERHPEDDDHDYHNRYSSSGSDNESSDDDGGGDGGGGGAGSEIIEYTDEFGRTRTGTRASLHREQRRAARSALGASELAAMSALPPLPAPSNLIYGDAIQTAAFNPASSTLDAMAALAAKRDRSPTPPPDTHFDGRAEIRTKGTGFYQFSREEGDRAKEMAALGAERENTERVRRERGEERERRRREIEERRRKIGARRAEKMAENFLEGLAGEMGIASSGGGDGGGLNHAVGGGGENDEGKGKDGGEPQPAAVRTDSHHTDEKGSS